MDWCHRGYCTASKCSDIIGINAEKFRSALDQAAGMSSPGASVAYRYACHFVHDTCDGDAEMVFRCTDIWGDRSHVLNILSLVAHDVRRRWSGGLGMIGVSSFWPATHRCMRCPTFLFRC